MVAVRQARQTPPAATEGVWYVETDGADGAVPVEQADELAVAVWEGYRRGYGAAVRAGFVEGARRLRWLPRGHKPEWDATLDLIERLASER